MQRFQRVLLYLQDLILPGETVQTELPDIIYVNMPPKAGDKRKAPGGDQGGDPTAPKSPKRAKVQKKSPAPGSNGKRTNIYSLYLTLTRSLGPPTQAPKRRGRPRKNGQAIKPTTPTVPPPATVAPSQSPNYPAPRSLILEAAGTSADPTQKQLDQYNRHVLDDARRASRVWYSLSELQEAHAIGHPFLTRSVIGGLRSNLYC